MNENGQNGCKVFASIAKFGETKYKPIRKHENNIIKQNVIVHPSKRTKIEENEQPKNRVNKFFKSRNPTSALEASKPVKIVTANITPIKNEPKFRHEDRPRYKEEKPLKIKIKKEKKESPKKIEKVEKEKHTKSVKIIKPLEESPYVRPTIKSPPAVSNQTRYSTRSRRVDSNDRTENENNQLDQFNQLNELNRFDQITQLNQFNELDQQQTAIDHPLQQSNNLEIHNNDPDQNEHQQFTQEYEHNLYPHESGFDQEFNRQQNDQQFNQQYNQPDYDQGHNQMVKEKEKIVEQIKPIIKKKPIPTHQYGTRRSRRRMGSENNDDNELSSKESTDQISATTSIDLKEQTEHQLNCDKKEIKSTQNKTGLKDDFVKFFTDENEDEDLMEVETNQFSSLSQPVHPTFSSSQKTEIDQPLSLSQPIAQQSSVPSSSTSDQLMQNKPIILPQKKRFFSKTDKEKKVQYNVKNFFVEFEEEEEDANKNKNVDAKLLEYDSDKLKKVKEAHKCAELGEAEHFDGEIKFYLSGIKDKNNTNSIRCLSILGLTHQCLNKPELRMHLRAHDYMGKIIRALMDSPKDPNLATCAACLMFVYNQDRLTMDIDPNALSLMLELLETKADQNISQIEQKHSEKIVDFCKTMKNKGHGKYLKLNEISAGTLAMETLLGLTSKRAGDWFKEELRTLKGIDYLVDTILNASEDENNQFMQEESELNKIDRTLRVIENVTCQNKENQEYVINYKESEFIRRCIRLYELCKKGIIYSETTTTHYLSPLLSILRVFTNLTSDTESGCAKVGESIPDIFDIFLNSVFELPSFVVPDSRFDLIIFLLCLCLNLIESCDQLHDNFINNESQIKRLIVILEERYDEAKKTEQQADDFLDSEETQRQLNSDAINIDSILTDLVAKSGKHMEHTIIAACISLLIGSGLKDNYKHVETVRKLLPNNSFTIMIDVITKLKEFSNLASIMTKSGIKRVESILAVLKHISK